MKIKVKCKMCGKCCRAIGLKLSHEEIKNANCTENDKILKDILIPISRECAMKRNNDLVKIWNNYNPYAYKCKKFKSGKCSIHFKGKPDMCSEYPFYKTINPYGIEGPTLNYSLICPYNLKEKQALYDGYKLTGKHYREWKAWKEQEIVKVKFLTAEEAENAVVEKRDEYNPFEKIVKLANEEMEDEK